MHFQNSLYTVIKWAWKPINSSTCLGKDRLNQKSNIMLDIILIDIKIMARNSKILRLWVYDID